MIKICKYLLLSFLISNLLMFNSYAGEPMRAGTVLKNDSYVFSVKEAEELMSELKRLEALVSEYKELDIIHETKEQEFNNILASKTEQIEMYNKLYTIESNKVLKLEKNKKLEQLGIAGISIGATIGLVLLADKIDDSIENTGSINLNKNNSLRLKVSF